MCIGYSDYDYQRDHYSYVTIVYSYCASWILGAILYGFKVPSDLYQLGSSRLFFRAGGASQHPPAYSQRAHVASPTCLFAESTRIE
jgi:hypothetical protein